MDNEGDQLDQATFFSENWGRPPCQGRHGPMGTWLAKQTAGLCLVGSALGRAWGWVWARPPPASLAGCCCAQADVVTLWKATSTANNDSFVPFPSCAFYCLLY